MTNKFELNLTYIDPDKLEDKISKLSRNIVLLKNSLTKLDNYFNNLNDKFLWESPGSNMLLERYVSDKKNFELICGLFESYISYLMRIKNSYDDRVIKMKKEIGNL